jgi:hypothetical protein
VSDLPVDPDLTKLAISGLDYGVSVAAVEPDSAFSPAVITTHLQGPPRITQLMVLGVKIDDVFGYACKRLSEMPDVASAAVVMDGSVATGDAVMDAVIVRVGIPTAAISHEFFQRYRRAGLRRNRIERVANIGYGGEAPPLFTQE